MIESNAEWRLRTDYGQIHIAVRNENGLHVKRRQKFPIRVEKNGVTVPVYRMLSGSGYTSFVISYRENGARKKKGFGSVGEAVRAAKKAAGHIASGNASAVKLQPDEIQVYLRAATALKPFRIRVDAVASEYVAAVKILGKNATLLEAARHYSRTVLGLPPEHANLRSSVVDILQSYQLERHIKRDEVPQRLKLKKEVILDPDFQTLWNRIKSKTTYSVEYQTETLIANAVKAIKAMEKIHPVRIQVTEAGLGLAKAGVTTSVLRDATETVKFAGAVPDVVAYLQGETELTRSTIVRIITESKRLPEFLLNPQKYMDAVLAILKQQLHKLIIDGIKYEKLGNAEYEMRLFEDEEIMSYLNNRLDVKHSVYDAVVYDSEIEREFAEKLDKREDIKLFVKLPDWFKIETPLGTYNPDWAILKDDDKVLYLVRETKGTRDFEKLRNIEAEKIRCGRKHFESLDVDFAVVTSASEV